MTSEPHPTAANFDKNWSTESKNDVASGSVGTANTVRQAPAYRSAI